jgi:hypothetical protein
VSTHVPEHLVCPEGHVQAPPAQLVPVGQTLPHVPQLCGSLLRSVQAPLHMTCAPGQPHVPSEQVWPPPQT